MPDTSDEIEANRELMVSFGHAIMQWAVVELNLCMLFLGLVESPLLGDPPAGELLWARVRSFDAKILMLHDLATTRIEDQDLRRDWTLLREHITSLYNKRNQLAHSTGIVQSDGQVVLAPFATLSKRPSKRLGKSDVDGYASEFMELADVLNQFQHAVLGASLHPLSQEPESDLLDHLRTEDDRKREVQRHRSLAWRQYLHRNPDLDLE